MLRVLVMLALAILAAPTAAAEPLAGVRVAPMDDGHPGEPYYLWANVTQPDPPRPAKPDDDCAYGPERPPPPPPDEALVAIAERILAWTPLEEFALSAWFPTCVATEVRADEAGVTEGDRARASYDVTTGRYYVSADAPTGPPIPVGLSFTTGTRATATGTTGMTIVADCEGCPPPG